MKRKTNMWSILLYGFGIILIIGSFWRYYITYRDLSEMGIWMILGTGIFASGWVYEQFRTLTKSIEEEKQTTDSRFTDIFEQLDKSKEIKEEIINNTESLNNNPQD